MRFFRFGRAVLSATTLLTVTLYFYLESLRRKFVVPGRLSQDADNLVDIKFNKLLAALAVEMTVGSLRDTVVAGDTVADIDFLRQPHPADQFQITPDGAVADRPILLADFIIQFIDRNVLPQFKKGIEYQLPLRGYLKTFCS